MGNAGFNGAAGCKYLLHLLRQSVGGQIIIRRGTPQQHVPDTSSHNVAGIARLLQQLHGGQHLGRQCVHPNPSFPDFRLFLLYNTSVKESTLQFNRLFGWLSYNFHISAYN